MERHVISLITGIIFGVCIVLAGFANPDNIIAALRLKKYHVIRTVVVFLLVGLIGTWIIGILGTTDIISKPAAIVTLIIGGLFVGAGLGLTGYSPSTSLAGAATGKADGIATIIGMFLGAHAYIILYPFFIQSLEKVHNYGNVTLPQVTDMSPIVFIIPAFAGGIIILFLTYIKDIRNFTRTKKQEEPIIEDNLVQDNSITTLLQEEDCQLQSDSIEAAHALVLWKNIMFGIMLICLILLEISFWIVSKESLGSGNENTSNLFFGITFNQITIALYITNTILLISSIFYVIIIFFCLSVSLSTALGGLRYISRSFFFGLLAFVLLVPWQIYFKPILFGAVFMPSELANLQYNDSIQNVNVLWLYLRFVGYWTIIMLILIRSQIYSSQWTKSIFGKIEEII